MARGVHYFLFAVLALVHGAVDSEEPDPDDIYDSSEHIGPSVTQIHRHPYIASLLRNNSYVCSAVILNNHWAVTLSKCFDSNIISSYVSRGNLSNFTLRVGSSYNNKGGAIAKIKMLINNFDLKVSAVKFTLPLVFNSQVDAVRLPKVDEEPTLGFLASMVAWTPSSHIRLVNAPIIESSICEDDTKLLPGHYICIGGVQDPNRHFCRQDNGGGVIQNDTLIGISSFSHTCAVYTKPHAFPKVSSFTRWLDSVIWDEGHRPTSSEPTTTSTTTNTTEPSSTVSQYYDSSKYMLTLPFDPINVPLEPAEDNSVIPRMSLYESYLQNLARAKTSTTLDPSVEEEKKEWLRKYGKAIMMMPPSVIKKNYEKFDLF